MKVQYKLNEKTKLTDAQIERLNALAERPVDLSDQPELSDEQLRRMHDIAQLQREMRKKEVVAIRLDQESIGIAKALGKGYTGIMGRILYKALRDPQYIRDCL